MAAISSFLIYLLLLLIAIDDGNAAAVFTTSLFHREFSLLSPLHNPSLSHYHRLDNAFRRSFSRSAALHNRAAEHDGIQSSIAAGFAEYLMSVSIGTPPVQYIAIADTGSDLTWTQCLPCQECYNQSLPIFDPEQSSSFRRVTCTSQLCRSLGVPQCGPQQVCDYSYMYGDQTYTKGGLGFDKITLGSASVDTVIGCGHDSGGGFGDTSGIIGLGGGQLSLISQMTKNAAVACRFSYCLPTLLSHADGEINFGQDAVVSGPEVVSTPLVPKAPDTFYYMTLEAVSVGNERHAVADGAAAEGNMIIDTGTTLTYLPKDLYDGVVSTLVKVVQARRVEDPGRLCFATDRGDEGILDHMPIITAHFGGGADVKLLPVNTFAKVADDVNCLTLTPTSPGDGFGILGNLAQANFFIGIDLEQRTLSFKPAVCA